MQGLSDLFGEGSERQQCFCCFCRSLPVSAAGWLRGSAMGDGRFPSRTKCQPIAYHSRRTKCEGALLERLQLATDVALQAGAAMKAVINLKKEGIVHKGATDL